MCNHYRRLDFSGWPPLFKVKGQMSENTTFGQIKLVISVGLIPRFCVIFTGKLISDIILMNQGHFKVIFARSKGQFEGRNYEKMNFSKYI